MNMNQKSKGRLIVIEGSSDGVGKTTQYAMLATHLKEDGEVVIKHHFPSYGTTYAKPVEEYLKGNLGNKNNLSPYMVNSLYAVDRACEFQEYLKEEYNNGKTLLLDRYTTSSLIYQSALLSTQEEKINFIKFVEDYEYNKLNLPKPDKVIFLHVPYEISQRLLNERAKETKEQADIHEQDKEYLKKVYDNSMFVSNYLNWDNIECTQNEKMRNPQEIHKDIYKLVKKR